MPTVKGVFSLFASLENNRKSLRKFLLVEKIELNLAVATKSLKFSNDTETLNPLAPTGVINFTNVSKPPNWHHHGVEIKKVNELLVLFSDICITRDWVSKYT